MRVTAGAREARAAEGGWYRAKHPKVGSAPAVVGLLLPHGRVAQPAAHPPRSQAHGAGSKGSPSRRLTLASGFQRLLLGKQEVQLLLGQPPWRAAPRNKGGGEG